MILPPIMTYDRAKELKAALEKQMASKAGLEFGYTTYAHVLEVLRVYEEKTHCCRTACGTRGWEHSFDCPNYVVKY